MNRKHADKEEIIRSESPEETWKTARKLVPALYPGSVVALHGELGSGKTCFVQGMAAGCGVEEAVTSPTYTLIHEYRGLYPFYHIDLYRIGEADDLFHLGLDEYIFGHGVTAIEWAERAEHWLPSETFHVFFELGNHPTERIITIKRAVSL